MDLVSRREAARRLAQGRRASVRTRWGAVTLEPPPCEGERDVSRRWGLARVEGLPTVVTVEELVPGSHARVWIALPRRLHLIDQVFVVAWAELLGVGKAQPDTLIF